MNAEERFFFVHMQKTAGIALRHRLIHHFGERAVYPAESVDGVGEDAVKNMYSVDYLRERLAERGDEIRVIAGHFPLCTRDLLGQRFTTLTLLREPVDRTLSFLRYHREHWPADRDKPLEEIYEDPFWFEGFVQNHQTKMLSLSVGEMTGGMATGIELSRDHLERAKDALVGIDAVGLQERFGEFCDEIAARFGWDLGEQRTLNASEPAESSDAFRARIAEDNALDVELYEFATQLVADRVLGAAR